MSIPIYLACGPEDRPRSGCAARMGFRLAQDYPSLYAPILAQTTSSDLMVLQDDIETAYTQTDTIAELLCSLCRDEYSGLVCDFDKPPTEFWQSLCTDLGTSFAQASIPLWVPESYAEFAPDGFIMISSEVSGGTFQRRLEDVAAQYGPRAVLQILPMRTDFPLPCSTGLGESLTQQAYVQLIHDMQPHIFWSEDLLCSYFAYDQNQVTHMVLFDDETSLRRKLDLAEAAGFHAAIGLCQELEALLGLGN